VSQFVAKHAKLARAVQMIEQRRRAHNKGQARTAELGILERAPAASTTTYR
jgi:hypothetical protein